MKHLFLLLATIGLTACTTLGQVYDATPIIGVNRHATVNTPHYSVAQQPEYTANVPNAIILPDVPVAPITESTAPKKASASPKQTNTQTKSSKSSASTAPKTSATKAKPTPTAFRCGTKSTCSQMNSCQEAIFFLKQCGVRKLDRNKDGVPCESICG